MVEREVFLINPKHQYYLLQRGDCVYGSQSLKEKRLLSESMFTPIERRLSILKMVERYVFLMNRKFQLICPNEENEIMVPNH